MPRTPTTPRRMVAWQGFAYVTDDGTEARWSQERARRVTGRGH